MAGRFPGSSRKDQTYGHQSLAGSVQIRAGVSQSPPCMHQRDFGDGDRRRDYCSGAGSGSQKVKTDKPIRKTPTFEQFQAIVESIRSQIFNGHDADESAEFVEFLGLAGLGQAEASALEWPDIDFKREQITTFRHKTKSGFAIPLYPQLRPLLEKRYTERRSDGRVFKINVSATIPGDQFAF